MSAIPKGYPSKDREIDRAIPVQSDHVTAQPIRKKQIGQDAIVHQFLREVGTDTCEADCTTTLLNLTAHAAQVGDVIRFTSGNLSGQEVKVISVSTDSLELGEILSEAPSTDTIQILRHKYPIVTSEGALQVSATNTTEDSPSTSGDDVTAIASVRQDVLSGDTSDDGDYAFIKSNANGEVYVTDTDANATLSAIQTSVELLDNAISGNELQVDVVSSALPTGAATAANQASVISELQDIEADVEANTALLTTIDADTSSLAGCVGGTELQVDVVSSALPTGAATEATLASIETVASAIQAAVEIIDNTVSGNEIQVDVVTFPGIKNGLDVVDQIDTAPLLDTSSTNIPASASSPVEVVNSLAANVSKIQIVEDIGSFIGIYTGAAASEVLKAVLPLGGGEVELQVSSGTRISLRAMENAAISSGKIAINFLG